MFCLPYRLKTDHLFVTHPKSVKIWNMPRILVWVMNKWQLVTMIWSYIVSLANPFHFLAIGFSGNCRFLPINYVSRENSAICMCTVVLMWFVKNLGCNLWSGPVAKPAIVAMHKPGVQVATIHTGTVHVLKEWLRQPAAQISEVGHCLADAMHIQPCTASHLSKVTLAVQVSMFLLTSFKLTLFLTLHLIYSSIP